MHVLQQPFKMYGLLFLNGLPVLKVLEIIIASIKVFITHLSGNYFTGSFGDHNQWLPIEPITGVMHSKLDVSLLIFFINYIFPCEANHKSSRMRKDEACCSFLFCLWLCPPCAAKLVTMGKMRDGL